jgi:hypothetical protein
MVPSARVDYIRKLKMLSQADHPLSPKHNRGWTKQRRVSQRSLRLYASCLWLLIVQSTFAFLLPQIGLMSTGVTGAFHHHLDDLDTNFDSVFHRYSDPPAIISARFKNGSSVELFVGIDKRHMDESQSNSVEWLHLLPWPQKNKLRGLPA